MPRRTGRSATCCSRFRRRPARSRPAAAGCMRSPASAAIVHGAGPAPPGLRFHRRVLAIPDFSSPRCRRRWRQACPRCSFDWRRTRRTRSWPAPPKARSASGPLAAACWAPSTRLSSCRKSSSRTSTATDCPIYSIPASTRSNRTTRSRSILELVCSTKADRSHILTASISVNRRRPTRRCSPIDAAREQWISSMSRVRVAVEPPACLLAWPFRRPQAAHSGSS